MAKASLTITSDTKEGAKAIEMLTKEMQKLKEENRKLKEENKVAHEERMKQLREERDAHRKKSQEEKQQERELREEKARADRQRKQILQDEEQKYKTHRQLIGRIGGAVMAVAGTWMSVSEALNQINARLERQKKLQDDIRGQSMTIGGAKESLLANIGGYGQADQQQFLGMGERLATDLKLGGEQATVGIIDTIGTLASSGASPGQAEGIIRELSKRTKNVKAIAGRSQAIYGLMSKAGMSESEAVEFFDQVGQNIYGKDATTVVQPFAKVKSAAQVAFPGADPRAITEQGAELYSALTQLKEDATGSEAGTSAQRYIQKMGFFFEGDSSVRDIDSAIAKLRSDPNREKQFLSGLPEEYRDIHAMAMRRVGGGIYDRVQQQIDLSRSSLGSNQMMAESDFDIQTKRRGQANEAEEFYSLRKFKEQLAAQSESRAIYESVYKEAEQDFGAWAQATAYSPARYLYRPFLGAEGKIQQDIAHTQRMAVQSLDTRIPGAYYEQFAQMYEEGGVEGLMQDSRVTRDEANIFARSHQAIQRMNELLEGIRNNTKQKTVSPQGMQEAR